MREVAWVVFDEIHYMRDKGQLSVNTGFSCSIEIADHGIAQLEGHGIIEVECYGIIETTVHGIKIVYHSIRKKDCQCHLNRWSSYNRNKWSLYH